MTARELRPEPLTRAGFAPFGDVVEAGGEPELINRGSARQFADLARIDVTAERGRPCVSIFRALPVRLPHPVRQLERHLLGSQCFVPLNGQRFLIVVAPPGDAIEPGAIRAFVTNGRQGVNFRAATWHHALLAWRAAGDFLVIDRASEHDDCDERALDADSVLLLDPG